jgi:hypothetical protein
MQSQQPPIQITAWIIWFATLNGLVMIQFFIGGGFPSGINENTPPALLRYLPAAPAFFALVIRFLIIPRIPTPPKRLPAMIIGIALAEATGILGIFLLDKSHGSTQLTFFTLSLLAILALAPVYLKNQPDPNPFTQ